MELQRHSRGNCLYAPSIAAYSEAVRAEEGYEINWVVCRRLLPYVDGLQRAVDELQKRGRPPEAICSVALRSRKSVSFKAFEQFNEEYVRNLTDIGILSASTPTPVTRTNVVPRAGAPDDVALYGFAFTQPARGFSDRLDFVISGAAELRDQQLTADAIVAPGAASTASLVEKSKTVVKAIGDRLRLLNAGWEDADTVSVYTLQSLDEVRETILAAIPSGMLRGLRWYPSQPPVSGLVFEMDVRRVAREEYI